MLYSFKSPISNYRDLEFTIQILTLEMTTGYPREYIIMRLVYMYNMHLMDSRSLAPSALNDNAYQVQTVHSPEVSVSST